ncbi:putative small G-protein Ras2 [Xylaria arbuscula]|nr:putative small G-protein Ras2 [Xylaria arbuscula]
MSDQFLGMVMQTMQPGPLVPLVVVLGDSGVGKTALTIQWCHQQFVKTYDPTIEDSYRTRAMIDGQTYPLEVLDTAGHEDFGKLQDHWISQADGIILVYNITERNTFRSIRHLVEQVLSVKEWHTKDKAPDTVRPESLPIMIIGNQCDRSDKREVDENEGHALAKKYGCMFVEASAKHNRNVKKAFFDVVKLLRKPLYQEVYDDGLSSERASSQSSIWKAWRATFLGIGCCIFM